jgi:hypothetical protein
MLAVISALAPMFRLDVVVRFGVVPTSTLTRAAESPAANLRLVRSGQKHIMAVLVIKAQLQLSLVTQKYS